MAQRSCPRFEVARGVTMKLVDSQGTVLAEDVSGPDGSFVLWPETRPVYAHGLFITGGNGRVLVPEQERLFSKECTTFNKCVVQAAVDVGCPSTLPAEDVKPASAVKTSDDAEDVGTGRKPSSKLLPKGYMTP